MISVRRFNEVNGVVDMDFKEISHLLYHNIILSILKEELNCEVLFYNDLITDIDCGLRWNGIEFEFNHHYIFGNIIRVTPEHADAIEQLAKNTANIINEKAKLGKSTGTQGDGSVVL